MNKIIQDCPHCKTNNSVIPIVFGEPTSQTMEKAEKKLVYLGGCMRDKNGDDKYYCKVCEKKFR